MISYYDYVKVTYILNFVHVNLIRQLEHYNNTNSDFFIFLNY